MSDAAGRDETGWLRDQPATWHEMNRALQDVAILLQYLGELPDARLLNYFEDTQAKLGDSIPRHSLPPCENYAAFLQHLCEIASAFQTGHVGLLPAQNPAGKPTTPASCVGFVYLSRDFLSAVSAPATAESIRLTRDYLMERAYSLKFWHSKPPQPKRHEFPVPALPPDVGAQARRRLARKLARSVSNSNVVTVCFALLTIVISVYALSGRLILVNQDTMQDKFAKLDTQAEAVEDKLFEPVHGPITEQMRAHFQVTGLCELTRKVTTDPAPVQVANSGTIASDSGPAQSTQRRAIPETLLYAVPQQLHLCDARAKAVLDLFIVTVHLQSWSSATTHLIGYPFGVIPQTLSAYSQEDPTSCFALRSPGSVSDSGECKRVLWDEIDRSRHVADSILGAITQYVLPVFYGLLGAMAASMRSLRRKVDASVLSYTDRSRLQQGAILGVLCGAVIGLFSAFLGGAGGGGNIGISAIALLAGYNVDGVFRFLDELSDRLFRPGPPPSPGRAA